MAIIEAKGYVNKPVVREANGKKFATFTLAERQLDRNKQPHKVFYNVTDFKSDTAPEESSFVTVKGYLNVRDYEKDGVKRQSLDISAQSIEVAPPLEGKAPGKAKDDDFDF